MQVPIGIYKVWSIEIVIVYSQVYEKKTSTNMFTYFLIGFICGAVAGSGKVGPVNQVNHTSWVAVVTPTDRPKSVRNRCLIELFVALFVFLICPFDISVGVGDFVIGLRRKRRRCDPVLWQNPLYQQENRKPKDNTRTPPKTSIT